MEIVSVRSKFSLAFIACLLLLMLSSTVASANTDLNGIGTTEQEAQVQTQQQPVNTPPVVTEGGSNAEAVGSLFENVGVNEESTGKANKIMSPVVYWANVGFSVLLAFAFVGMFFITGLDLVYIAIPPVRKLLLKEQPQGGGGMGGGFGGGMGGFGGGMGGGAPQQSSSGIGQWISDEAKAAVTESQPQGGGGGMGGGFGGGMGGFGGGFGGGMGGGSSEPPKTKSVLMSYMKKRLVFLVLFGVCALLLSTTLFTDIGISIGTWIMNRLLGINESIPE